ncbi:MAG: AAA family ATPase [Phycisphaerales bacterium]|nr:AAA family ATPase [Phycisphaerales bacterium]
MKSPTRHVGLPPVLILVSLDRSSAAGTVDLVGWDVRMVRTSLRQGLPPVMKPDFRGPDVFDRRRLPPELDEFIRRMNPWWEGKPGRVLPDFRRWAFAKAQNGLLRGVAPITVIRGPRQIGKSTIQDQIIEHLLYREGVNPKRILKVQYDDLRPLGRLDLPVLDIAWWYENRILGQTFNEAARSNRPAFLFLDEVQNLQNWAPELKSLVDQSTVRVLVTGSSALRIESGRDSLAGRISTVELGPLLLREVASLGLRADLPPFLADNGLDRLTDKGAWVSLAAHGIGHREARDAAFTRWARRGGYPRAHERFDVPWAEMADALIETVVNRAIQHDLRQGDRGRKRDESLLKQVFTLACRYTGQTPRQSVFVEDIKSALDANIGWQRVSAYLSFLEGAMLLKLIPPLELRLKRRRGPAKICICDHGLRAAWLQDVVALDPGDLHDNTTHRDQAGRIAEGIVGFFLSGIPHLDVAHFPERGAEPEVDFVLTIGDRRIPVEIKYRRNINPHNDTRGLRAFIEKSAYNAPFGVLVTMADGVVVDDPRIAPVPLRSLLLLR